MSKLKLMNSDKEMNAVRFNMKEQRCLQKSLSILDEEASYAIKLIDLNNRGIKIFYQRFRNKVSKIKSYLNAEQVAECQEMEKNGQLEDLTKPLNITGALKIADAEKRLKLQGHENARKPKSAIAYRSQTVLTSTDSLATRGNASGRCNSRPSTCFTSYQTDRCPPSSVTRQNSIPIQTNSRNSITGAFMDTPDKNGPPTISPRQGLASKGKKKYSEAFVSTPNKAKTMKNTDIQGSIEQYNTVKSLGQMVKEDKSACHDNASVLHTDGKPKHVRIDAEHTFIGASRTIEKPIAEEPETSNGKAVKSFDSANRSPSGCSQSIQKAGNQKRPNPSLSKTPLKNNYTATTSDAEIHQTEKHVKISDSFDVLDGKPSTPFDKRSTSRSSKYSAASKHSTTSAGQFSCHSNIDRPTSSCADVFKISDDKIGGYLGEDPYEVRRKNLLQDEEENLIDLQDRKDDFLDDIDRYITSFYERNRAPSLAAEVLQLPESVLEEMRKAKAEARTKKRLERMQRKMHRNSTTEQERVKRVADNWKDVNKCRYLRVPSDKIDLSGIVTLASAQMKLFKTLRPIDNDHEHETDNEDDQLLMSRPKSAVMQKRSHAEIEANAAKANIMEQQKLQKNLKALGQEETYTMRLLKANSKEIEKYCERLSEKISKVRSHLNSDEIEKMRKLEASGKLKSKYPSLIPTSASRLAAEARRLKLSSANRPKTSLPVRTKRRTEDDVIYIEQDENQCEMSKSSNLSLLQNDNFTKEYDEFISSDNTVSHAQVTARESCNTTPSVQDDLSSSTQNLQTLPERERCESYEVSRLNANSQPLIELPNQTSALSHINSVEEITENEPETFSANVNHNRPKTSTSERAHDAETNGKLPLTESKIPSSYVNSVKRITPSATKIRQPASTKQAFLKEDAKAQAELAKPEQLATFNIPPQNKDKLKADENIAGVESRYSVSKQLKKRRTESGEIENYTSDQKTYRPKTAAVTATPGYIDKNRRMRSPDGNKNFNVKQQLHKLPPKRSTVRPESSSGKVSRIQERPSTAHNTSQQNQTDIAIKERLLSRPQTAKPIVAQLPASPETILIIRDADELLQHVDNDSLPNISNKLAENGLLKKHVTSHDISKTSTEQKSSSSSIPKSILRPHTAKNFRSNPGYHSQQQPWENENQSGDPTMYSNNLKGNAANIPQRVKIRPQTTKPTSFYFVRKDISNDQEDTSGHSLSFNPKVPPQTSIGVEDRDLTRESPEKPRLVSRQQTERNEMTKNSENHGPSSYEQGLSSRDKDFDLLNKFLSSKQQSCKMPDITPDNATGSSSNAIPCPSPQKPKRSLSRPKTAKPVSSVNISHTNPDGNKNSVLAPSQRSIPRPATAKHDIRQRNNVTGTYPIDSNKTLNGLARPGASKFRSLPKAQATSGFHQQHQQRKGGQINYPEVYEQPSPPNTRGMLPRPPSAKTETNNFKQPSSHQVDNRVTSSMIPRPKTAKTSLSMPCGETSDENYEIPVALSNTPRSLTRPKSARVTKPTPHKGYEEQAAQNYTSTPESSVPRPQTAGRRVCVSHDESFNQTTADRDHENVSWNSRHIRRPQTAKTENMRRSAASNRTGSSHHSRSMQPRRVFDSHAIAENQAMRAESPSRRKIQEGKVKHLDSNKIDCYDDIQADIIEAMLQEEKTLRSEVDGRLNSFLNELSEYTAKNRQKYPDWHTPDTTKL